ncbi:MAG TPA: hypothetical protein VF777_06100 [Phycisphaerales bacterium]
MGLLTNITDRFRPTLRRLRTDENARPSIGSLLRRAGTTLPARVVAPIHRNDRGVVSIFFLLMFFTFFNATALVYNTGQTLGPKLKAQAAADVAAYNSSVIMSRAINLTAQTNYAAVRNASAFSCAIATVAVYVGVPINWLLYIKRQYDAGVASAGGVPIVSQAVGAVYAAAALVYILTVELPPYIEFITATAPSLVDAFDTFGRPGDLADFQKGLIAAIPQMIEDQRKITEEAFGPGMTIRLTQPIASGDSGVAVNDPTGGDTGLVAAPLQEGNLFAALPWFNLRFLLVDTGWPRSETLRSIVEGKAVTCWWVGGVPTINGMALFYGPQLHMLTTQWGPLEFAPDNDDDRKAFSVVASATEENESKRQLFLNYWFKYGINNARATTAYAQAETYLGLDSSMSSAAYSPPIPWRAWTPPGANWAGRLTRSNHFGDAFNEDATMRDMYKDTKLQQGDVSGRIPKLIKH